MQKIKPYRNTKHLAWIRSMPCCHCGTDYNVVAHHLRGIGFVPGGSAKDTDAMTIPLCTICHADVHSAGGTERIDQLFYFARIVRDAFNDGDFVLK